MSISMYIFDYKEDIIKDKPIDERGVPEILFEAAAEVDQVAPLASLGAAEGEVRRGDRCQERDPGQLDSRAAQCSRGSTTDPPRHDQNWALSGPPPLPPCDRK